MSEQRRGGPGFVTGLVLGGIAGAALAMILAPQSGEDTRDLLIAKARVDAAVSEGKDAAARQRAALENENDSSSTPPRDF